MSKSSSFVCGLILGAIIAAFVLGLAFIADLSNQDTKWQTQCVRRGAAEWVVEDNGKTEFHWLMEEPKETPEP